MRARLVGTTMMPRAEIAETVLQGSVYLTGSLAVVVLQALLAETAVPGLAVVADPAAAVVLRAELAEAAAQTGASRRR